MVLSIAIEHEKFNLILVIYLFSGKWLNSSFGPIDGSFVSFTAPGLSGPESNCNEEVLHIPQRYKTGASP